MRRVLLAIMVVAALWGSQEASAQVKLRTYIAPKIINGPMMKAPVIKVPVIKVIPPSLALNRAMMLNPQSQALGVKLRGPLYIVKLKQGNKIVQVHVDAATGDVSQ